MNKAVIQPLGKPYLIYYIYTLYSIYIYTHYILYIYTLYIYIYILDMLYILLYYILFIYVNIYIYTEIRVSRHTRYADSKIWMITPHIDVHKLPMIQWIKCSKYIQMVIPSWKPISTHSKDLMLFNCFFCKSRVDIMSHSHESGLSGSCRGDDESWRLWHQRGRC